MRLRGRTRLRSLVAVALVATAGLVARSSRADDVQQAKMYFDAGAQAYAAGRFAVAVSAFDLAFKLAPRPAILFSMAQAERKQWLVGSAPDVIQSAMRHYRQYLSLVATGGRRADAAEALAELEPIAAKLGGATPTAPQATPRAATRLMISSTVAGATASIDDGPMGETPLMEPVLAGKHRVKVRAPGYFDEARDVVALEGEVVPAEVALQEKPAGLAVAAPDGTDILVDGRTMGTTPLPRPLAVPAGTHFVALAKNGYRPYGQTLVLVRENRSTLTAHLERTVQRDASYVTLGAGATAVIAGGVFMGVSLAFQSNAQSILHDREQSNISSPQLSSYTRDVGLRDGWRDAATATLGAGAGVLAVGAVLYFVDHPGAAEPLPADQGSPPPPRPKEPKDRDMEMGAAPWIGPGMVGAAWTGRF